MRNTAEPASTHYIGGRWLRLASFIATSLLLSAGLCICALMLVTPSVGDAPTLVREFSAKHQLIYREEQPPTRFTAALVATEDHRFYSAMDIGIDPFALARLITAYTVDGKDAGGSSIAQQLAKMLYTPNHGGEFSVDLKQVILAIKLHFFYSSDDILKMYSDVAYFGGGYYGLEAASEGYFGRRMADLSWLQAALLAGIVNAPSADNPRLHATRALRRCRHVFRRLVAVGYLSQKQAALALKEPLELAPKRPR
jgi:penicillin-binding protein 1A